MDHPVLHTDLRVPPAPLGQEEIRLGVGPLAVAFGGLSSSLAEAAHARYGRFVTSDPAAHHVLVGRGEERYLEPAADGFLRLEESPAKEGAALLSTDFAAWRAGSQGTLRLSRPGESRPALGCLENYLRWTVADMALDLGGFVLHSAGVVKEGKAYLFYGASGAGKSTVSELSRPLALLSDDLVLVLKQGDEWTAAATPFAGTLPQEDKVPGAYPLAGLYRLVQAREHRVAAFASPALAVASLLACCPFVADPGRRERQLLPLLEELGAARPPSELYFLKDGGFWTLLP